MTATRVFALIIPALLVLCSCATARLHKDALREFDRGAYEQAIRKLEQVAHDAPGNMTYRLDLKGRREEAVHRLLGQADRERAGGALDAAESTYRRVLTIEPGNERALRSLDLLRGDRRHAEIMALAQRDFEQGRLELAQRKASDVLAEDPAHDAANALRSKIETALGPRSITPRLRTRDNRPVTLQFRDANTKMVFEVLSRQTGINFIFDKDVKSDGKTTIFVQQVPIEQAIDLVLGQNQLARQVLAENMVMIYPNTPAKQAEYQEQIVRTFYVSNADPKRVIDLLKTMLNARTLFMDEHANAIVIRDTPELVRMAERLLTSVDVPEAEVMMEVEVLEISRTRLEQLGLRYPDQITVAATPLTGENLVLRDLGEQDDTTLEVSPIAVGVDLRKEVGASNLLASPRIRARNREKARVLIGQRVPVITNTVTPISTGAGVVTGNVQYVDVGLTLEVEPIIHLDRDVAIRINLEVSNIIREVTASSGTLAYQIGTRNASTVLRLRDGETQILAGLIQDTDRRTSNHLPGIGDLPLVGRLFGSKKKDEEKTEIILSITPRIVRMQPRPASENTEFWYGTELSLRSSPLASVPAGLPGISGSDPTAVSAANTAPAAAQNAEPSSNASAQKRPELTWEGPGEAAVGQTVDVTLRLASEVEIAKSRTVVRFDPATLELTGAEAGSVVPEELRTAALPVIAQRSGRAQLEVAGGAMKGEGALLVLHFKALSARPSTMISVQQFAASGADGVAVPSNQPKPLVIAVKAE